MEVRDAERLTVAAAETDAVADVDGEGDTLAVSIVDVDAAAKAGCGSDELAVTDARTGEDARRTVARGRAPLAATPSSSATHTRAKSARHV